MRILICSDGTAAADEPTRTGSLIAGPGRSAVTLLGVAEGAPDEAELRRALQAEAEFLERSGARPEIIIRTGEPIDEILQQTKIADYDLVVIGSRIKRRSGHYWRSSRTYEVIKSIAPPVLVAAGECKRLKRILVCSGGKDFIDAAVKLSGEIAAAADGSVTLLHVMAEPPALYAGLARLDEDVETLLAAGSELGQNLRKEKESLEKLGVPAEVRLRRGYVLEQIFAELEGGDYDLITTGSSRVHGRFQQYIMGDVTRGVLNRARCPVLVARSDHAVGGGLWSALKRFLTGKKKHGSEPVSPA